MTPKQFVLSIYPGAECHLETVRPTVKHWVATTNKRHQFPITYVALGEFEWEAWRNLSIAIKKAMIKKLED